MPGETTRPDPDALLRSIKAEERDREKSARGTLKIFFGMAAGVGKTFAMLEAAHRKAREGVDIVIGYIETHGRVETEELVRGLEVVPRRRIDYQGIVVEEFDIDAVLARRPGVVLVDELAHTNAAGSRHAKRYQDVLELLDNGISVFTTLNVQHLESLADVVEKITEVKIRETLPDSVLDLADEVELVDIPPEELLKRLAEGKVYVPEKAGLAAERFFRKGNITALREMALHYTARLVGSELRDYTQKRNIVGPWKSGERLLVAVSPSPYSEYLIRWTRRIAFNLNTTWIALYIEKQKELSEGAQNLLMKNLRLARELGAEVISTADEDIVGGLLRIAQQKNITQIVVGKPLRRYVSDYFKGGNLVERLLKESGDIEIHVVTQPDIQRPARGKPSLSTGNYRPNIREYLIGGGVVSLVTIVSLMGVSYTGYWVIALVYLLSVVLLSLVIGRWPVFMAATLSALAWNFLFIPPLFTFRIGKAEDAIMFGLYFIIALVMGGLTSRLRLKEWALRTREKRITGLYEFSKALGESLGIDQVLAAALRFIREYLGARVAVLLADDAGRLVIQPIDDGSFTISEKERAIAEWVFKNRQPAGRFTATLPHADAYYTPLVAPGRTVGVMAIVPASGEGISLELENFLQNITYQLSMRIERENLSAQTQKALLANESERLYNILLNSVTHEIRTPLTAIKGSISTLMDPSVGGVEPARTHLLYETQEATERMIRLVDSLLDMSRIESGKLSLNLDWNEVSDIINTTLNRMEAHPASGSITVDCPDDLPLVRVDHTLIAHALYSLIHNALVHAGPPGSTVRVSVANAASGIVISVEDDGPGLPEEDLPRIFDKFFRSETGVSHGGLGLGLSICRGITELHGGTVTAENRSPHGARFIMTLPVQTTVNAG